MSDNPTTVARAIYQAMTDRDVNVFDRLYDADVTFNGAPSSPEEIKGYCWTFLNAFEDLTLEVERLVADGEWVAARAVARGTHTAALDTLEATEQTIEIAQHDLMRVVGGRVVEGWTVFDQYAMLQQLGQIPAAA